MKRVSEPRSAPLLLRAREETQREQNNFVRIPYEVLTCGVCRHALRMASELECRVVYLCSGSDGCIPKCVCLLFMDIILARASPN